MAWDGSAGISALSVVPRANTDGRAGGPTPNRKMLTVCDRLPQQRYFGDDTCRRTLGSREGELAHSSTVSCFGVGEYDWVVRMSGHGCFARIAEYVRTREPELHTRSPGRKVSVSARASVEVDRDSGESAHEGECSNAEF